MKRKERRNRGGKEMKRNGRRNRGGKEMRRNGRRIRIGKERGGKKDDVEEEREVI